MSANTIHEILQWGGACIAVVAAFLWIKSTVVKVLSPHTSGWGALVGGEIVVPGTKNERLDLMRTLQKQSLWNKRAAIATAIAAVLTAFAPLIKT